MYHFSTACVEKKGRVEENPWTKTLVSGGARGVSLKYKFPLMDAWEERLGFLQEDQSRLRVITSWGMK